MKAVFNIITAGLLLAGLSAPALAGCGGCSRSQHNQCVGNTGLFCRCCVLVGGKCGNNIPGSFCWGCGPPWGSCPGGGTLGCSLEPESFCPTCTPTKTCADYPGQCGTLPNGCPGGGIVCGCQAGKVCNAGACCTPKTCADYPGQWGSLSNGCGGNITCACPAGQAPLAGGICQPPYTTIFYVKCPGVAAKEPVAGTTGASSSPLRFYHAGVTYRVEIVPEADGVNGTCAKVKIGASTYRLRKNSP